MAGMVLGDVHDYIPPTARDLHSGSALHGLEVTGCATLELQLNRPRRLDSLDRDEAGETAAGKTCILVLAVVLGGAKSTDGLSFSWEGAQAGCLAQEGDVGVLGHGGEPKGILAGHNMLLRQSSVVVFNLFDLHVELSQPSGEAQLVGPPVLLSRETRCVEGGHHRDQG